MAYQKEHMLTLDNQLFSVLQKVDINWKELQMQQQVFTVSIWSRAKFPIPEE